MLLIYAENSIKESSKMFTTIRPFAFHMQKQINRQLPKQFLVQREEDNHIYLQLYIAVGK